MLSSVTLKVKEMGPEGSIGLQCQKEEIMLGIRLIWANSWSYVLVARREDSSTCWNSALECASTFSEGRT